MLTINNLVFKDVLKNLSITFEPGIINVIIGPNGSGKSVLFKNILGLLTKTSGEIVFDGQVQNKKHPYFKGAGALIEEPDFNNWNSGIDNLKFLASINGKINLDYVYELMKRLNIFDDKDKVVRKYSLGMKKKLGIIQAIMEDQNLIILDEPSNGLDKESIIEFHKIILELKEKNKTILIASHIDSDITDIADRVIRMEHGEIVNDEVIHHD
jgi:ABC-2 type transport system ATP-binding protein